VCEVDRFHCSRRGSRCRSDGDVGDYFERFLFLLLMLLCMKIYYGGRATRKGKLFDRDCLKKPQKTIKNFPSIIEGIKNLFWLIGGPFAEESVG
jgi:hypothetical protein